MSASAPRRVWLGLGLQLLLLGLYVALIAADPIAPTDRTRVIFFASFWANVVLLGALAAWRWPVTPEESRLVLLAVAVADLASGVIGLFTIGLPFLVAGLLLLSASQPLPGYLVGLAILVPILILASGLIVTG
jgi:hypothetical protein